MTQSVLIVGAGQAGMQCAVSLRQGGFDGKIDLYGDEAYPLMNVRPCLRLFC